jgi:hypothetical protein
VTAFDEDIGRDVANVVRAGEREAQGKLAADDIERERDTCFAAGGQRTEN